MKVKINMAKILEVKNLQVRFGQDIVHNNLSFSVEKGEMLTILGPNGAGKSVLLKALLGILPYMGEIVWYGSPSIEYLPQNLTNLAIKNLPITVEDFFRLKGGNYSIYEITKFLEMVGLKADILRKPSTTLSGGQFQRMLVAWVLISKPDVLLLDEPTAGIDIGGGENIYSLIDSIRIKSGLTVVLVTHDIHIVYAHSNNVLCLSRKNHTCFGKPKTILNPKTLEKIFGMKIGFYQHR